MGSVMDKWFGMDPAKSPKPPAPVPAPETETAEDMLKKMKKTSGRADTIIAGDLEPVDIGKRTLLG